MNEAQETEDTSGFKDNPINQLTLVDKYVEIELIKNCSFEGFLHSVDPLTNTVILSTNVDGDIKTVVIPGHAILSVEPKIVPPNTQQPSRMSNSLTPSNITKRKTKLMKWLKTNLITATEVDDKIIFGNVSILPPYSVMDICTDSPVVAMQIKKLIENMPADYN